MTRREVLTAAADLIESKGFTKKTFARGPRRKVVDYASSEATCFCASGAIMRVYQSHNLALSPAEILLMEHLPMEFESIPAWNDAPGRTAAEVIQKLREVAALPEAV